MPPGSDAMSCRGDKCPEETQGFRAPGLAGGGTDRGLDQAQLKQIDQDAVATPRVPLSGQRGANVAETADFVAEAKLIAPDQGLFGGDGGT